MTSFSFKDIDSVLIVAELSANHNGSLATAKETIKAAKRAGADAIKLQTYTSETITLNCNSEDFIIKNKSIWDGMKYSELYQKAHTPWDWHEELFKISKEEDILCFSSPFDKSAVDLLEGLGNPIYKIASFEITDIPLIKYIASKNKPIILSTGIAETEDIDLALKTIRENGNCEIALLKCVSSYPAKISESNLSMIPYFSRNYNVVTGLSDHTKGIISPVVAVSMGAKIIEKHFILDKSIETPDSSFSLDEKQFKKMVNAVKKAHSSIGQVNFKLSNQQISSRNFSRSLYICKDVKKGQIVSEKNVKSVRPGFGLHPKYFEKILGRKFIKNASKGTRLSFELLD